jgi:hypoxanthine phosphoribosyltransferase
MNREKFYRVSWLEIEQMIISIADCIKASEKKFNCVMGVPRGGIIPAELLARRLSLPTVDIPLEPVDGLKFILIDDICDSGKTLKFLSEDNGNGFITASLFWRHSSSFTPDFFGKVITHDKWLTFPRERLEPQERKTRSDKHVRPQ